jgi:hypothetical protein
MGGGGWVFCGVCCWGFFFFFFFLFFFFVFFFFFFFFFFYSVCTRNVFGKKHLDLGNLAETADGGADSGGGSRGDGVSTTSQGLLAALALPDTDSGTLDSVLAAEGASVSGVLSDFHLLDHLSQGSTITGTVLAGDADFLCALGHFDVDRRSSSIVSYLHEWAATAAFGRGAAEGWK